MLEMATVRLARERKRGGAVRDPDKHGGAQVAPEQILDLQRSAGNAAVASALQRSNGQALLATQTAEERAKAALKASIGGADHKECASKLAKRFPRGPLFGPGDLANIEELAKYPKGVKWLNAVGIGTVGSAWGYLLRKDYKDWLTLKPGRRLLIATIAWNHKVGEHDENPPPSFTLGRAMAIEEGEKRSATLTPYQAGQLDQAKKDRDAHIRNAFVNTIVPVSNADKASVRAKLSSDQERDDVLAHHLQTQRILTRILLILQVGLQVYDKGAGTHVDYDTDDVVRALAHGGRVNIRIPALSAINYGDDAYALMNWIGLTDQGDEVDAVKSRGFGTHHMSIGENKPTKKGSGTFKEEGGKSASLANKFSSGVHLYGVDLAAGGLGKKDFNGDVIMPDGGHGHMFVGFTKPTRTRDGALQIGIETTGPGAESLVGYEHTWQSTEATANPESSFYGHKMQKVGEGKLSTNQRLVDLNQIQSRYNDKWITILDELAAEWSKYLVTMAGNERAAYEELAGPRLFF